MTNDDAIKIALKNELISDIEAYQTLPKYKISLKFDKKMKHLLRIMKIVNQQRPDINAYR